MAKPYVPYDGPIVDRQSAIAGGLDRYFTGKPCKHGHVDQRQAKGRKCIQCVRIAPDTGKKDTDKERLKRWVAKNRERASSYQRKYRKENPNIYSNWIKNNPERARRSARAGYQNRRARESNAEGRHSGYDVKRIGLLQKWKCANCKVCVKSRYHVDHIIPISKGGTNWPSNLQILCPKCNLEKGAKDPIDWARQNGKLL